MDNKMVCSLSTIVPLTAARAAGRPPLVTIQGIGIQSDIIKSLSDIILLGGISLGPLPFAQRFKAQLSACKDCHVLRK